MASVLTTHDHPLLSVEDLTVSFHRNGESARAVNGVSFDVAPGETLAIMGESGSGKSVTSKAIMGLLPKRVSSIDSGTIRFAGNDILSMPAKEARAISGRDIGIVFQDPLSSLNPVYTVGAQISEAARRRFGATRREARTLAIDMLHRVGIPNPERRVDEYPHQFSGGMRQRVMIAIAIANKPSLLIADEPTTALDVTVQAQILQLLVELQEEIGMAMILITHDLGVVAEVADKGVVMYAGQEAETGSIRELFDNCAHPYTAGLLGSIPTGSRSEGALIPVPGMPPDIWDRPAGCPFAPRCRYTEDVCLSETPALRRPIPERHTGHYSACHFAHEVVSRVG